MHQKASLVPGDDLQAQLPRIGAEYFTPEALELCQSLKGRKASELSDDEVLMLALTAAQAALAKHVEPGNREAEETLDTILSVLDHDAVVQAELRKLHKMQLGRVLDRPANRNKVVGLLGRALRRFSTKGSSEHS
jgi:hypothetical protein